jgi:hypothetical protein
MAPLIAILAAAAYSLLVHVLVPEDYCQGRVLAVHPYGDATFLVSIQCFEDVGRERTALRDRGLQTECLEQAPFSPEHPVRFTHVTAYPLREDLISEGMFRQVLISPPLVRGDLPRVDDIVAYRHGIKRSLVVTRRKRASVL